MITSDRSHLLSGGRYPVLRTIGIVYLVGAALTAVIGLFLAAWALFAGPAPWVPLTITPNVTSRILGCLTILGTTFLGVISMLAIAEGIKLFMDGANSLRIIASRQMLSATPLPALSEPMATQPPLMVGTPVGGRLASLECLDDETAEAALIRGH